MHACLCAQPGLHAMTDFHLQSHHTMCIKYFLRLLSRLRGTARTRIYLETSVGKRALTIIMVGSRHIGHELPPRFSACSSNLWAGSDKVFTSFKTRCLCAVRRKGCQAKSWDVGRGGVSW